MKKVLVFGTFDGIHEGHRAMLGEAKNLGTYLIAAVAPDTVVEEIKGRPPKQSGAERISNLKKERLADEVMLADGELHGWEIISKIKPAIIALGYDQDDLADSLERHLEISYPDVEMEEARPEERVNFQKNPKRPTIVRLKHHDRH